MIALPPVDPADFIMKAGDEMRKCINKYFDEITLEEAVQDLGYDGCIILRPTSLIRKGSDRFGEKAGVAVLRVFNAVGLMRRLAPIPTEAVAAAMVRLAKRGPDGIEIISAQDILKV